MIQFKTYKTRRTHGPPNPLYEEYVRLIVEALRARLNGDLISVVLFGSVARGEAEEGSDIDLLVVSDRFKGSFGERFRLFDTIEENLLDAEARRRLRREGLGTLISPVPLTPEEVKRNPPILLDVLTDGIILHDPESFIHNHLAELKKKLKALNAKKVYLPDGRWYWDLKPDYKLGEEVKI